MTPPADGGFWDTALLYLTMIGAWVVGEGGKAALAGAAGGLVRWFMAERRRIREGCISVASGAMMAHFGTPLMLALLERWFGEFRGDVGNTAAFCAGSVTSSAAPITMRRANDGHQLSTMMPLSGGDEKICQ